MYYYAIPTLSVDRYQSSNGRFSHCVGMTCPPRLNYLDRELRGRCCSYLFGQFDPYSLS